MSVEWQRPICWLGYDYEKISTLIFMILWPKSQAVTIGFYNRTTKREFHPFPPPFFHIEPKCLSLIQDKKKKCFASVWTFLRMLSGSERKQTIEWKFRLSATLFAMFGFSSDSGSCQEKLPRFCWPPTSDRSGTSKLIMLLIIQKPLHLARVFFALGLDDEGKSSVCLLVLKQR